MKNILFGCAVAIVAVSSSIVSAEDCLPCKGKIDNAIMRYDSDTRGFVQVITRKGAELYSGKVAPYGSFTLSGIDNFFGKKNTLGPAISVYVDGTLNAEFHTSCSVPFGPGTTEGNFVVLSSTSRNNGLSCATGPIPDAPGAD